MKRVNVESNNGSFYIIFNWIEDSGLTIKVYDMTTSDRLFVEDLSSEEQELFYQEVDKFIRESF